MIAILLATALMTSPAAAPALGSLECNVGSVIEPIGGHDWIVHGCADGKSVVVVAGPPNPAAFFYFIVMPQGDGIILHGEGDGDKSATQAAYEQLKEFSANDLELLYKRAVASNAP